MLGFCEGGSNKYLCQLPGSDSLIRRQQYHFSIFVSCTRPTELLIVDQLCHLMAGKFHLKMYSVGLTESYLNPISPPPQLDQPALALKSIKEKETSRVARVHAAQYLHGLKSLHQEVYTSSYDFCS